MEWCGIAHSELSDLDDSDIPNDRMVTLLILVHVFAGCLVCILGVIMRYWFTGHVEVDR